MYISRPLDIIGARWEKMLKTRIFGHNLIRKPRYEVIVWWEHKFAICGKKLNRDKKTIKKYTENISKRGTRKNKSGFKNITTRDLK